MVHTCDLRGQVKFSVNQFIEGAHGAHGQRHSHKWGSGFPLVLIFPIIQHATVFTLERKVATTKET